MLGALLALALMACDGLATASEPGDTPRPGSISRREWHGLQYAGTGERQRMDVYLPNGGQGPYPVVVWIHGGSWLRGDKSLSSTSPQARLVAAGYAVASINYRYASQATHPAQVSDAKAAVRYLRAHAADLQLDSTRVAAWGGSAGAYLAAMLGTTADVPALDDPALGNAAHSSRVQAVVAYYPLVDFVSLDAQMLAGGCGTFGGVAWSAPESVASGMLGFPIANRPELAAAASPLAYVSADDAPTLIVHGTRDCVAPPGQGVQLHDSLAAVLGADSVQLRLVQGAGHGGEEFETRGMVAEVAAFLARHLSP